MATDGGTPAAVEAVPVFSPGQFVVAALVGGPLGLGLAAAWTLRRLRRPAEAARAIQWGVVLFLVESTVAGVLPLSSPILFLFNAFAAKLVLDRWLQKPLALHLARHGQVASSGLLVLVAALPLIGMILIASVIAMLPIQL